MKAEEEKRRLTKEERRLNHKAELRNLKAQMGIVSYSFTESVLYF
jgi:hypothetical protein